MDHKMLAGTSLVLFSQIVAAVSQVLLKKSAKNTYGIWWQAYINPYVITAYAMFVATTIFNIIALRYIPLTLSAALAASAQIFVPVLSCICFKEAISKRKLMGMTVIVLGIVIISL